MTEAPTTGRVVRVNVSPGGVPKLPVAEARVGRDGLDGDAHHHDTVHGGPHRAIAKQAYAVLEGMESFLLSSQRSQAIEPQAAYDRPQPMPREPLWLCE